MLFAEAVGIAHTLSKPSKMPWFSYSIPASTCKLGAILAKIRGTVCNICYADKGTYRFRSTVLAMAKRYESLDNPLWVEAMATQLNHKEYNRRNRKEPAYFRWHDSGDIQSVHHLEKIVEVCERTPCVRHWLPTRETAIVKAYINKHGDAFPENLQVRISSNKVGHDRGRGVLNLPVSTAGLDDCPNRHQCEASKRGGKCGPCRACWFPVDVNYKVH